MTVFAVIVLTAAAFAFIAYPFFKQRGYSAVSTGDQKSRELLSRRDTTYSMLKELEFDYQSGILTEEDYRDLEARYKRKAISILKDADDLEKGSEAEEGIEAEIRRLRRTGTKQAGDEVEQAVAKLRRVGKNQAGDQVEEAVSKLRQTRGKFCPQCGTAAKADDRFCASCGAKLR
ncbi:MAG: zinc-ribbon domain-containing protein [Chloroflexi bacterium]|nr:zinc-ribbon domain-containing protein [Chloroflexota bacterium]